MRRDLLVATSLTALLAVTACSSELRAADLEDSVVRITGTACLKPILASGLVVAPGRVVTVAHAVAGADDDLRVMTLAGVEHEVRLVGFDPERDIALLAVDGLVGAPLLPAEAAPEEEGVIAAVDRELGLEMIDYTVLRVVNARSGDIYDEGHVERTALDVRTEAGKGTSGAPLVDAAGSYVGMVFAISRDRDEAVYALAASEIADFVDTVDPAQPVVDRGRCR